MATPRTRKNGKIPIIKIDNDFHYKPFSDLKGHETAKVPSWIFDAFIQARSQLRDLKDEINSYFN
jgi:hypothetical protein